MDDDMDMEYFIIQVEQNILENGKVIKNMEKYFLIFDENKKQKTFGYFV